MWGWGRGLAATAKGKLTLTKIYLRRQALTWMLKSQVAASLVQTVPTTPPVASTEGGFSEPPTLPP